MSRPSRLLAVAVAATVAVAAVAERPGGPEAWAHAAAPTWSAWIVPLSERGPWPWTPLAGLALLAATVVLVRRAPDRTRAWTRALAVGLLVVAGFEASWGLHGGRPPAAERLGLASTAAGATAAAHDDAVRAMAARLGGILAADAPNGPLDEDAALAAVRERLHAHAPEMRLPRRLKRLPAGVLGPWGVAGVISPWTLEAHVDGALPGWTRVGVGAHELAHLAGFASEADAEFVGLLASLTSSHPHARYAGALRAWRALPAELRAGVPLPAAARSDLAALEAVLAGRRDGLARPAWRLYDLWLRSRGQPQGIAGYGQGPRLLARALEAGLW